MPRSSMAAARPGIAPISASTPMRLPRSDVCPVRRQERVIDVGGRVVTPGFIDLRAHLADEGYGAQGLLSTDAKRRAAQNYVAQGVTTAVTNPDGSQALPLRERRERLERNGIGVNVILLNGHSGMRREAMNGDVDRAATADEIRQMQAALRHDLAQEGLVRTIPRH